jgi:hypothetical protein
VIWIQIEGWRAQSTPVGEKRLRFSCHLCMLVRDSWGEESARHVMCMLEMGLVVDDDDGDDDDAYLFSTTCFK